MKRQSTATHSILVGLLLSFLPSAFTEGAAAQTRPARGRTQPSCAPLQELNAIPEIRSRRGLLPGGVGLLKGEMAITSGSRTLWGSAGDTRCASQDLRYLTGRDLLSKPSEADPAFAMSVPLPGPTLRARAGDLIQLKFWNVVDTQSFPNSLDSGLRDPENTTGCDEVRTQTGVIYPNPTPVPPGLTHALGDTMPNCLHGSSTSNIHFHGTHTTPNTTGDNILLFVKPALRDPDDRAILEPNPALVDSEFEKIFARCADNLGSPTSWEQLPAEWRADQERLLRKYDNVTPYKGKPGPLPEELRVWPVNEDQISKNLWPQYQLGAFPYCFRLGSYPKNKMGQAPGTHWYHAHKHGSTALNVANGLTGALVVEGPYDDALRAFYGRDFKDRVLVIQQLSTTPFPVSNPATTGPGSVARPQLSVNGGLNPVVRMRPGEVQLWRLVNGAFRDAMQLRGFAPGGPEWRQIAQDGVQLSWPNYNGAVGAVNAQLNLAPANRADLLVKAPAEPGRYALSVQPNQGLPYDESDSPPPVPEVTLLTVWVDGPPLRPAQDFIDSRGFPDFPTWLADIPDTAIKKRRKVVFGNVHNLIDGQRFDQKKVSQTMTLNSSEEWQIFNEAPDKAHPFHIHINPFQITEIFEPNAADASYTDKDSPCYIDQMDPATWKPCTPLEPPYVWWDVFAIPTSKTFDVTEKCSGDVKMCPEQIQPYVLCYPKVDQETKKVTDQTTCTQTIPGYFKMRSNFVDFTGTYVVHCHILIHEDRGMMQLVEVVAEGTPPTARSPYVHH